MARGEQTQICPIGGIMQRKSFLSKAFIFMGAVFFGLLISLWVVLTFAPNAAGLQTQIGIALIVWCVPSLYVLSKMSANTRKPQGIAASAEKQLGALLSSLIIFLLLTGFFVQYGAKFKGALMTRPQDFAQTQGRVVESEVIFQPSAKTSPSWRYHVTYDYKISGVRHLSSVVNFDWVEANQDRSYALEITKKYNIGQSVLVFYLPKNPGFAVLDPAKKGTTPYLFYILVVVTLCCVATCLLSLRALIRQKKGL